MIHKKIPNVTIESHCLCGLVIKKSHIFDYRRSHLVLGFLLLFCITVLFLLLVSALRLRFLFSFFFFWYFHLLERCVWVHAKLLGHQPVYTVHQGCWVSNLITRLDQCSLEENGSTVNCTFVLLVSLHLAKEIDDHWV